MKLHNGFAEKFFKFLDAHRNEFFTYYSAFRSNLKNKLGIEYLSGWQLPLFPIIIDKGHYSYFRSDFKKLLVLLNKIPSVYFKDNLAGYANHLCLSEKQTKLILSFNKLKTKHDVARPDCILSKGSLKIIETNIGSGIGLMPQAHILKGFYENNFVLKTFFASMKKRLCFSDPLHLMAKYLNRLPKPIWMIPSKYKTPNPVFDAFDKVQSAYLHKAVKHLYTNMPREIVANGSLNLADGTPLHSVYQDISVYQLLEREKEFHPILDFLKENTDLTYKIPPSSLLIENKINLAILSQPENWNLLGDEEVQLIKKYIPWTRKIDNCSLVEIGTQKDKYVLKKAASHAGKHLCVGKDCSQPDFDQQLRLAIQEGNWIVQKYIPSDKFRNIFFVDKRFHQQDIPAVIRLFYFGDTLSGFHCSSGVFDPNKGAIANSPGYNQLGDTITAWISNANELS